MAVFVILDGQGHTNHRHLLLSQCLLSYNSKK